MKPFATVAIALASLAGPALADPAPPACQMQLVGELPITVIDGMPTIDAQINGKPVKMLVDTGSDATLLFRAGAAQLHLALRHIDSETFYGVGGGDQPMSARLGSLRLANMVADDIDVLVVGHNDWGPVQGVLGARFLTQTDVEFDIPEGKLRFFRPKACEGDQVVYWGAAYAVTPMRPATDEAIYVTVRVNGAPLEAQMDTGASLSVLTPQGAAKAGVTPKSEGVAADGATTGIGAAKVDTFVGVFPTFSFGDETIRNARLRIADLFHDDKEITTDSRIPDSVIEEPRMLLGTDFFQSHRVYVARSQRKIYVSYTGGPVFQTRRDAPAPGAK